MPGYYAVYNDESLQHHGIMGMKWGVRRYQNADGTLTSAGRRRYGVGEAESKKKRSVSSSKTASKAKNEPELSRAEKKLVKAQIKVNNAEEAYAKSVARSIDKGKVYVKKGADGKKNEVYMTSNDLGQKQRKLEKASVKVNKKVEAFKKKYGSEALSSLEKKAENISALTEGKKRINEILKYTDEYFKYLQTAELPDKKSSSSKQGGMSPAKQRESLIKKFVESNKPSKGSPNTLKDIDDMDLIDMYIDDADFRKEYGVSDSEYKRYKKELG